MTAEYFHMDEYGGSPSTGFLRNIPCPNCGTITVPDIHADVDGPTPAIWYKRPDSATVETYRAMDNWICMKCAEDDDKECCWSRDDEYIQDWIRDHE